MDIKQFVVSPLQSNCYVLSSSSEAASPAVIVDPGAPELDNVFQYIDEHQFQVEAVWCTHGHVDHILGVDVARTKYGVKAFVHKADNELWKRAHLQAEMWFGQRGAALRTPDEFWKDGDIIRLGNEQMTIWHTPGHSPGGVCIVGEHSVITGDTLFAGSIGRTDFPESNPADMKASLQRLLTLPDEAQLYPGHMQSTNMAKERKTNPFLVGLND